MRRSVTIAVGLTVAAANVLSVFWLTGYAQRLADSPVGTEVPEWVIPAWLAMFFPARYVLLFPAFNHPMGLGGPRDTVVWLSLMILNGVIWGCATYLLIRRLSRGAI